MMSERLREKPNAEDTPQTAGPGVIQDGRYMPPPADGDGKQWVRTTALIRADPHELYTLWRNVESAPMWQEQIASVTEPGKRIAWRSIGGDSNNAGEVMFEQAPGGRGTYVTVLQEFRMGKLASAWETLRGRNPKQAVIENLRHFKQLAETGEIPRIQGQPHGPRGVIGGMKESAYAEKIATPAGLERKAS
jgi:hypothetical protein